MLRNRNYLTLVIGQLVSTFGNNLYAIALPWFVYVTTGSKADLAILSIAMTLPQILGLFSGVLVDRWPKMRVLVYSDSIRVVLCAVMALIAAIRPTLWPIVILALLLQVVGVFFGPAASALVPSLVGKEELPKAIGFEQSSTATAQLLGTLTGGGLLAFLGAPLLFAANGFSFVVSVASLLLMPFRRTDQARVRPESADPFWVSFRDGLSIFKKSRFLLLTLVGALIVNFAFAPFDLVLTAWVKGPLQGNAFDLALLNATFFVGLIAGGLTLQPVIKRISIRWLFCICLVFAGVSMMVMGILPQIIVDCLFTLLMGFVIGTVNGGFAAIATRYIPKEVLGRTFGTVGALFSMASPIGVALFGVVITHSPLRDALFGMGSLGTLAGLLFLLPVREDIARAFQSGSITDDSALTEETSPASM